MDYIVAYAACVQRELGQFWVAAFRDFISTFVSAATASASAPDAAATAAAAAATTTTATTATTAAAADTSIHTA